jgi:hypothetical protein
MDCKAFKNLITQAGIDDATADKLRHHYESCETCRERHGPLPQHIIPDPTSLRVTDASEEVAPGDSDELFGPVEFKDAPITFTLVLDGKEEEIKLVEPELDYPIPEDGRLRVYEKKDCLTDVIFKFDATAQQPYGLLFYCQNGVQYKEVELETFGKEYAFDKNFTQLYKKKILDRGGVEAWIEMTRGKARVHIIYKNR